MPGIESGPVAPAVSEREGEGRKPKPSFPPRVPCHLPERRTTMVTAFWLRAAAASAAHLRGTSEAGCSAAQRTLTAGRSGAAKVDSEREIKTKMHQLYKRVHPDLFQAYPKAKEANEKSFKLLQQFISDSGSSPAAGGRRSNNRGSVQFNFYLKSSSGAENVVVDEASTSESLQKIDVELHPPRYSTGWLGSENGKINPKLTPALNKLLKACGLDTIEVDETDAYDDAYAQDEPSFSSSPFWGPEGHSQLREFLPFAVDRLHNRRSPRSTSGQHLDMVRSTLRLFKGLTTSCAKDLPEEHKSASLNTLVKVLDADASINLTGLKMVLDQRFKVSPMGAIHVNAAALTSRNDWSTYLSSTEDLALARERSAFVDGIRLYEDQIAAELGIASLHCSCRVLEKGEACKHLLEEVLERARSGDHAKGGFLSSNKVVVDEAKTFSIDKNDGTIRVPLCTGAGEILDYLSANGMEADRITFGYDKELKELERLRSLVRSRLKLRIFTKDDKVTLHQFRQCSNRLVRMSKSLVTLTDGLNVRVSDENRLNLTGNSVDIAWDFA